VNFVGALDMGNGKLYTLLGLTMRVMVSDIFGKLRMRIGWVVNYGSCILRRGLL